MTKRKLGWGEVLEMLRAQGGLALKVYGVPPGGAVVAGLLEALNGCVAVGSPALADLIVFDRAEVERVERYMEAYPKAANWAVLPGGEEGQGLELPWEGKDPLEENENEMKAGGRELSPTASTQPCETKVVT